MEEMLKDEKIINDEKNWNNKSLTFDDFVVDINNSFAYVLAKKVVNEFQERMCNPVFIYGKSGTGKSHLLQAIRS